MCQRGGRVCHLEDCEHALADVVEVGDAVLRPLPVEVTHRALGTLVEPAARGGLLRHLSCTVSVYYHDGKPSVLPSITNI